MSELERSEVEEVMLDDQGHWEDDPFTPTKLLGVAVVGALGALALYYLYSTLDPDKRERIKDWVVDAAQSQMRQLGQGMDSSRRGSDGD